MGCDDGRRRRNCCVCQQVKIIDQAQKESQLSDCCLTCDNPRLGNRDLRPVLNTRPFKLILPNGEYFTLVLDSDPESCGNPGSSTRSWPTSSCLFRVESVDENCCAILRALAECPAPSGEGNQEQQGNNRIVGTPFCCHCDLCRFICIQCFADRFVPLPRCGGAR